MGEPSSLWIIGRDRATRYRVLATIGGGGEGRVHRCEAVLADRPEVHLGVVIKQIPGSRLGDPAQWLARNEGLAHVSAPGLVRVLGVFVGGPPRHAGEEADDDPQGYVVMEDVTGALCWMP